MFKSVGRMTADDVWPRCIEFIKGKIPEHVLNEVVVTVVVVDEEEVIEGTTEIHMHYKSK